MITRQIFAQRIFQSKTTASAEFSGNQLPHPAHGNGMKLTSAPTCGVLEIYAIGPMHNKCKDSGSKRDQTQFHASCNIRGAR